jgi:class 3 adenylate cyclase
VADSSLTLEALLAQHPWPERMLARGRPMEFLWHFDLGLTAAELWPYMMDTSRFNRAMGLGRMEFREEGGVRYGSTRNAGVLQEWVEEPWTWVSERGLTSVREYSRGFAHTVRSIYSLEPRPEGVRFHVYFGWIPRSLTGRVALRLGFPGFEGRYRKVLGEIEAHVRAARPEGSPYRQASPALSEDARRRLGTLTEQLAARLEHAELAAELARYVESGDEMDLHRIQVRPLARSWGVDERELLLACLHATRVGMLSLSWDVICPHCRGVRKETETLADVPPAGSCEVCKIDFENDTEGAIEVTFHVHPSIREIPKLHFCSAEPSTKAHILLQQRLEPGQKRHLTTALAPGLYRRRLGGEREYAPLEVVEGGPAEITWKAGTGGKLACAPGAAIWLVNPRAEPVGFVIEDVHWSDDALRPGELFSLQEFRDLFARESLASEVKLHVGEQTILFTDMVGSTRFYEQHGDPVAFREVRRHFTELYEEVRGHRGAVVKTIGDAVMAAFPDPALALRAAAAIHARFPPGRADTPVRLRISMNTGPCLAVNLNAAIDYFGRTVNLAAKLQALVEGGQIVFTRAMLDSAGVRDFLGEQRAKLEDLEFENKAFDHKLAVVRWDLHPPTTK